MPEKLSNEEIINELPGVHHPDFYDAIDEALNRLKKSFDQIIRDKDTEIENWKKVVLSEQATIQELKKQIEIINQKNNT